MNKKSKKTLKNAFNIPEPTRKDEFLSSLEVRQKKSFSFNIPLYISTAVTAAVVIGIWGGVKNLPYFQQPDSIDTPAYSETISTSGTAIHTETTSVQTTTTKTTNKTSLIKTTVTTTESTVITTETASTETSSAATVSSSGAGTETTVTTVQTAPETTTTTITERTGNISHKPTTSVRTTERTTAPETEAPETTTKKTTTRQTTTARTTTQTTVRTTTSTTIRLPDPTTTTIADETNYITTTTTFNAGLSPAVTTTNAPPSIDVPPVPMTTTETISPLPDLDFTVFPSVRYYPDDNIYTIDSESVDNEPIVSDNVAGMLNEIADDADLIAEVEVEEIIYTGIDGKPYVQENVVIKHVFRGDILADSKISIYCKGGYIPASEYSTDRIYNIESLIENNVTILDYAGNNTFAQVGDSYICLLNKSDSTFPEGSYSLATLNDVSKFWLDDGFLVNNRYPNIAIPAYKFND